MVLEVGEPVGLLGLDTGEVEGGFAVAGVVVGVGEGFEAVAADEEAEVTLSCLEAGEPFHEGEFLAQLFDHVFGDVVIGGHPRDPMVGHVDREVPFDGSDRVVASFAVQPPTHLPEPSPLGEEPLQTPGGFFEVGGVEDCPDPGFQFSVQGRLRLVAGLADVLVEAAVGVDPASLERGGHRSSRLSPDGTRFPGQKPLPVGDIRRRLPLR